MNNKYTFRNHNEPSMEVSNFTWKLDETNTALLEWEWPEDRRVKFMLVVEYGDNAPDMGQLLREGGPHTVITRNLASRYQQPIPQERVRYMVYPAYFGEENNIVVYGPGHSTDWMYKKSRVTAYAVYKPLSMSKFQQVNIVVQFPEPLFEPEALWYGIYENERLLWRYPLDKGVIEGNYRFYIKKDQEVRFTVEPGYSHAVELVE